jgi:LmeA-like phospholipid-binding
VVVAAVAAEAVVRSAIDGRITAAAHKRLTGPVSVGIGATPALFDAVTGQIPTVTIQAPSTSMCILRDVSATASLTGVHRAQDGTAVQGTSADVTLTMQTFTALLSRFASAEVTSDPARGQLRIGIGPGGRPAAVPAPGRASDVHGSGRGHRLSAEEGPPAPRLPVHLRPEADG